MIAARTEVAAPATPERFAAPGVLDFARVFPASDAARGWQGLEAVGALPTQCLMFVAALAGTLLAGSAIAVFAVPGETGLAALLPLCRDPGAFARWRLPGAREVFEPGDALSESPDAVRALAASLIADGRPLDLDRVPAGSPLVAALYAAARGRAFVSVRPALPCPTIALGPRWREPDLCFNAGRRSDFRRAARRAAEFGALDYAIHTPTAATFDALFDEAIGVELRSWKDAAGSAIASDPAKEAFFRAYFRAAAAAGLLRIAMLRIDGRAAAMQLAVEWAGRFWLFKIGYDEHYARCSPGTLLMLHSLRHAAERGLAAFELLGGVEPWIAEFWTREQHDCVRVRTYPFGPRGAVALGADGARWLRERLRRRGTA